jgi:hypothetical protein
MSDSEDIRSLHLDAAKATVSFYFIFCLLFSQDSDVTNIMKKLLSSSNTEDIFEILRFLLEWIVLGLFLLLM